MTATNDKYVVFKRNAYEEALGELTDAYSDRSLEERADAMRERELSGESTFVIRKGDIIAFTTLRSYVSNILTLLELAESGRLNMSVDERSRMEDLADMAAGMADMWQQAEHKIPD